MRQPGLLIDGLVTAAARRYPQAMAAALGDRQLTFAEVAEARDRLAANLWAHGVRRGDRVAWWAKTSLEALVLYCAVTKLGAMLVPLNPNYTDAEGARVIERTEPALVLTDDGRGGYPSFAEFAARAAAPPEAWPEVDETDIAIIFFTSGTTGEPKGCMLSQRTQVLRGMQRSSNWPVGPHVCMFPQFHMAGWAPLLGCWMAGEPVIYVHRADATDILEAVSRHRATRLYCIPAVWRRVLEADWRSYDLSSLKEANSGTSVTPPDLLQAIHEALPHTQTAIVYGSTEIERVCGLGPQEIAREPFSVGTPANGVQVRLDENGELWARSPLLFSGYFRDEAATAAAVVDGWYRTGEIAERDEEGYYYIVGRNKDLIRTGGESVAPVEVDLVLQKHPALADAAVAGLPDPTWGEIIAAFVVPRPGQTIDLEEIRQHCAAELSSFKHPRRLYIMPSLPRTGSTQQIQRRLLIQSVAEPN